METVWRQPPPSAGCLHMMRGWVCVCAVPAAAALCRRLRGLASGGRPVGRHLGRPAMAIHGPNQHIGGFSLARPAVGIKAERARSAGGYGGAAWQPPPSPRVEPAALLIARRGPSLRGLPACSGRASIRFLLLLCHLRRTISRVRPPGSRWPRPFPLLPAAGPLFAVTEQRKGTRRSEQEPCHFLFCRRLAGTTTALVP